MMFKWIETKYGYELINDYSGNQVALMKFDSECSGEYYISCIENYDTGRNYLNSNELCESKEMVVKEIIGLYEGYIRDNQYYIEQLKELL